ncbi:MAG: tRNA (adenosine(37)-N6)-threonylcarbamoyltransferase complex dimerization subunit type 1 TsaB [Odoribacter sp.]
MALLLNIDTSTEICSVALSENGKIVALKENKEGLNHSVLLGTYIDEILREHQTDIRQLDAIAVSMGPGSYTGLRIGISMAKGLCFGAGKPMIAIPTLQALAQSVSSRLPDNALYCPMIDARRMEVYTAFFDRENREIVPTKATVIDSNTFADLLSVHKIYFFGNGSEKVKTTLTAANACYIPNVTTSAAHLVHLSEQYYNEAKFVDVAYFEPFYLKDFIATTPKKVL